jgi:hypothetical protein
MNIPLIKNLITYAFKDSKKVPIKYYKNHFENRPEHPNIVVKYGDRILFAHMYSSMKDMHTAVEYADILQKRLFQCDVVLEIYENK